MTQVIKVAKKGVSANSLDPNDFVFHSSYNTFKILETGTKSITLSASTANQSFTQAHSLAPFTTPIVTAFAKRDSASQVFAPNAYDVELYGAKLGFTGDVTFNYVQADQSNITFNFDNDKVSTVDITIRYYLLG